MGIYVQQQHFQEELEFNNIWANPLKVPVEILINERLVTIHFSTREAVQTISAPNIIAYLPQYLEPIEGVTNFVMMVRDDTTQVFGHIRIANDVVPDRITAVIQKSTGLPNDPFSGSGLGGFPRFEVTYILKNTR